MIYIFLADGFEEIEAIATLDILKRANINVKTVGVNGNYITGAHGVTIKTDETNFSKQDIEGIILPGGMPGTTNLDKSIQVNEAIDHCVKNKLYIFSICAAPSILGSRGLFKNKNVTCFPGFEKNLLYANVSSDSVCVDENFITAKGPGVSFDFAFKIVEILKSKKLSDEIKSSMQCIWIMT